ncbi:multicopper oxidase family protein [Nocardia sp. NPDC056100]|uniref:multicopper oxidase family protein n=1 Tax=Nocardia sp. NPDC056100 TaxID=3345712 RepID=UPI0035DB850D
MTTRRQLLAAMAEVGVLLGVNAVVTSCSTGTPKRAVQQAGVGDGEWTPPRSPPKTSPGVSRFTLPFRRPPELRPTRDDPSGTYYDLAQQAGTAEIIPGLRTPIWGYGGTFPGPTVIGRSDRPVIIRHRNELRVPVSVHLHGGRTPATSDGYPTDLIAPGGSREYTYPQGQRAATLWYHDHRVDFTAPQVHMGLAGFHLIRDDVDDALPLPKGDKDIPVLLTDRLFEADGAMFYPSVDPSLSKPGIYPWAMNGFYGDTMLVNGVPWPLLQVSATKYRFRILNASNARIYELKLDPAPPGGVHFVQVGSDGGLLAGPVSQDRLVISPAERFDVIIDFAAYPVGTRVVMTNGWADKPVIDQVMAFDVVRTEPERSSIPAVLSTPDMPDPNAAVKTRKFEVKRRSDGMWGINGDMFDEHRISADPKLGTTEIWEFTSDVRHPMHLHLVHFAVLSRSYPALGPFDAGLKDTVHVRPGETVRVAARFDGWPGKYVFHCHNLEHEDMMMMANFQVTP